MGKLRDQMDADLEVRGYSFNTKRHYLRCVESFVRYWQKPPSELGFDELHEFVVHLTRDRKLKPRTINTYVVALRFLYTKTLDRPEVVARLDYAKIATKPPEILSGSEVALLINAISSLRYRAAAMLAYGAGLRIGEVVALDADNIDSRRMVIRVEASKNRQGRYVPLPQRVLDTLHFGIR